MKHAALVLAFILSAAPASAQFGRILDKAQDVKKKADTLADMHFSDAEERQLGEHVSDLLVNHFGVYQDAAVTKYVSLVGTVLAQASPRPNLNWQFIVLDTDGVNAYAAPGGLIHITRGALGLIRTEAELAGVLGHEIAHVTEKHTLKSIQKAKKTELVVDVSAAKAPGGGLAQSFVETVGQRIYEDLFENRFDRKDEMGSDKVGIVFANAVGYAPTGMIGFLGKIAERNKDIKEPNGLFASHPQIKDRVSAMEKQIRNERLNATATVAARYASIVKFEAVPVMAIKMDVEGVRGAVGNTPAKADEDKKDEKSGGRKLGLGSLKLTRGSQDENTQTVASAGSRGGVPDRNAVGGPNKARVKVTISAADVAEFRKGIS